MATTKKIKTAVASVPNEVRLMATTWSGSLNTNEIFSAIYNMIIGQQVFTNNIADSYNSLVERARIDGTLFGDTYLKYSTDALNTKAYDPDSVDQLNVLATHRPNAPFVQAITIDKFRFIPVTIDSYFTKRAFSTESAFSDFNSATLQWLRDTKRIYDTTTYNAYVGTVETSVGSQAQTVDLSSATLGTVETAIDNEGKNRLIAEAIAQKLAGIFTEIKDPIKGKKYNDLAYYRSYAKGDLEIIWNADWVNLIRKVGLPTIFNNGGLLEIKEENILPADYFGTVNDTSKTTADASTRSLVEQDVSTAHYWASETITSGTTLVASGAVTVPSYQVTPSVMTANSIICKIVHKDSIPYMSGFETETEFINGKNRSENHYLHFGHNTLTYLLNYPLVTLKASV